jgi:hypothetical protein
VVAVVTGAVRLLAGPDEDAQRLSLWLRLGLLRKD